jgi:ketosteroid isomerase-like protein
LCARTGRGSRFGSGESRDFATKGLVISDQNVEIVRRSFKRLSQSREEAERAGEAWYPWAAWLREFFHPEVEWRSLAEEPDTEVYRGYDGIRRLFDEWTDSFEDLRTEGEEFIEAGQYVVVPGRVRGLGRASGVEVELSDTFVFKLRKGKVIEVREYTGKAEALEAVALQQ